MSGYISRHHPAFERREYQKREASALLRSGIGRIAIEGETHVRIHQNVQAPIVPDDELCWDMLGFLDKVPPNTAPFERFNQLIEHLADVAMKPGEMGHQAGRLFDNFAIQYELMRESVR